MTATATLVLSWFLALAGLDPCFVDSSDTCPQGAPPPSGEESAGQTPAGPSLAGPAPGARKPKRSDGIYNGI